MEAMLPLLLSVILVVDSGLITFWASAKLSDFARVKILVVASVVLYVRLKSPPRRQYNVSHSTAGERLPFFKRQLPVLVGHYIPPLVGVYMHGYK